MKNISELEIGKSVRVRGLDNNSAVKRKLMDMGITLGAEIKVTGKAPLGDPIELSVRGYKLTLRKKEAEAILI
ncbi:ferrous iron transport protein A [Clostridium sp. LY3-2]|uniref:FeoA family protein n=1 Tax=Clostridium sp. LY3-2 TaxID=2942482 RepID=UPI0021537D42|nr:FeoA family protein [Clostridium sp. LY3-2]MCR6515171.1 ferrous iron transport protein A [Clostridium sp. LY3-2]